MPPGPPLPAEPELSVGTADEECAEFQHAIAAYGQCPNLEDGDRNWVKSLLEYADQSFAAGKKADLDEPSRHAIAVACRRAAMSIRDATTRCNAGPRPKGNY